ncbi:uncharacterized protein V1516DRAFT_365222 [Lipomyces oligophaga]|uniref:uncharacterized protein n=1 Tax=Lipomyces oligophaga TaxID=45792 RepID=UPI0034D01A91
MEKIETQSDKSQSVDIETAATEHPQSQTQMDDILSNSNNDIIIAEREISESIDSLDDVTIDVSSSSARGSVVEISEPFSTTRRMLESKSKSPASRFKTQNFTTSSTSLSPSDIRSRSSNDAVELEQIAHEIEQELEVEGSDEDLLDYEITESTLAWKLQSPNGGDDDDDDDDYESYDDDDDQDFDDDYEDGDQWGRTRGSLFPWLPRGSEALLQYSDLGPTEAKPLSPPPTPPNIPEPSSSPVPSAPLETHVVERVPMIYTTSPNSVLSSASSSEVEIVTKIVSRPVESSDSPKQVRFSNSVSVQKFRKQAPSSSISSSSSNSATPDQPIKSSLKQSTAKPESECNRAGKKISKFKQSRLRQLQGQPTNSIPFGEPMRRDKKFEVKSNTFRDIMERHSSPRREPFDEYQIIEHRSSDCGLAPELSDYAPFRSEILPIDDNSNSYCPSAPTPTFHSEILTLDGAPVDVSSEYQKTASGITSSGSTMKSTKLSPKLEVSSAKKTSMSFSSNKPVRIRRPGSKIHTSQAEEPVQYVDIEQLMRDNVVEAASASDHAGPVEDLGERDHEGNRPILSDSVVERPYKSVRIQQSSQELDVIEPLVPDFDLDADLGGLDLDSDIHRQEISVAYHRMRQKLVDKQNGYNIRPEEREFVPLDENGEVVKVSRFKAARLMDRKS